MKYQTEADLAADIVKYLENDGWEVFQEVCTPEGRADIVAKRNRAVRVVECKLSLTWEVIAQAWKFRDYATMVFAATPYRQCSLEEQTIITTCMRSLGVGWMMPNGVTSCIRVNSEANTGFWDELLCDGQKIMAKAGTNRGGYWTECAEVKHAVAMYVKENPGCAVSNVVSLPAVQKHFGKGSSSAIKKLLERSAIKHVRADMELGRLRLYPFHPSQEPRI